MSSTLTTLVDLSKFHADFNKYQDRWLSAFGISFTEFQVLHYLDSIPSRSMKRIDLAELIGLSASGITRLLNPMQKIGLVEKQESLRDARVSLVALTETGMNLYDNAKEEFLLRATTVFSSLSSKQQNALDIVSKIRL